MSVLFGMFVELSAVHLEVKRCINPTLSLLSCSVFMWNSIIISTRKQLKIIPHSSLFITPATWGAFNFSAKPNTTDNLNSIYSRNFRAPPRSELSLHRCVSIQYLYVSSCLLGYVK